MASRSVLISGSSSWHVFAGVRRDEDGKRLAAAATGTLEPVILDVTDEASIEEALGHVGTGSPPSSTMPVSPWAAPSNTWRSTNGGVSTRST